MLSQILLELIHVISPIQNRVSALSRYHSTTLGVGWALESYVEMVGAVWGSVNSLAAVGRRGFCPGSWTQDVRAPAHLRRFMSLSRVRCHLLWRIQNSLTGRDQRTG